jgi:hypothetical protein
MIYIEEYELTDSSKMDELIKIYDISKTIFDELNLSYIKNYTVYHSTENPNKIRGVIIYNEDGNTEKLWEDYLSHPKSSWVIEKIHEIIKPGKNDTYKVLYPF